MECSDIAGVYKRRNPKTTSLWKLLNRYFYEFEASYDSCFQKQYGFYRPVISHVVYKYLECGDYARFHPHLHVLVADGLFLESGYFFVMPRVDLRPLRELFGAYVMKMLKKECLV